MSPKRGCGSERIMASTNTFAGTPPLPRWKANRSIRRCHPYARKSASQAVLTKMQLTLHATRRTPHGASRLVQAMSAWSVKTLRGPSRQCRDARVYGHTTTTVHDNEHTHTPLAPTARPFFYISGEPGAVEAPADCENEDSGCLD